MTFLLIMNRLALVACVLYRRPSVVGGRLQLVQDNGDATIEAAEEGLVGGAPVHISPPETLAVEMPECFAIAPVQDALVPASEEQQRISSSELGTAGSRLPAKAS